MSCVSLLFLLCTVGCINAAGQRKCPSGGKIYATSISEASKKIVVDLHNKLRLDIASGTVKNQPRGINLKRMKFDQSLANKAKEVSKTCKLAHIIPKDKRWKVVGQNIYIERSSKRTDPKVQNWQDAVSEWFREAKDFTYPNITAPGKVTGHYRQVVFADTTLIGCDYIFFYDKSKTSTPFTKLYTCNYGPGATSAAPYNTGKSGCEKLC